MNKNKLKILLLMSMFFDFPTLCSEQINYISECKHGEFRNNLIKLCDNDPSLIKINKNPVSDAEGAITEVKAISWALSNNTHLTELDLSFNNTRDEGAKALAEMLKTNKGILRLNLKNNHIGAAGAQALDEAIKLNSCILDINLDLNDKIYGENGSGYIDSIIESINKNRERKGLYKLVNPHHS